MRIVVVGCGSIGARHTMNLRALGVEGITLVDADAARLNEIAQKYGAEAETSLSAALRYQPQAVLVCTPPHAHVPIALEAVRAGCHCFIEKPISDRTEGLDELLEEAKLKRVKLLVGYNLRYEPGLAKVREIMAADGVGRVLYIRAELGAYLPDWRPWQDYRKSYTARKSMGGGIILDASHELDLVRSLCGEAEKLFCAAAKLSDLEVDVEDTAEITLWFAGGVMGSLHLDMIQRAKARMVRIVGTKGTIIFDLNEGQVSHFSAATKAWVCHDYHHEGNQVYVVEMRHFLNCILGSEAPRISGEDGKKALQIALAAKKSAETGTIVSVPA